MSTDTLTPSRQGRRRGASGAGVGVSPPLNRKEAWIRRIPVVPGLVFMIVVTQLPFLLTIYYSTQRWNLQRGEPTFVGLANYGRILGDHTFREAAFHSIVMTVGAVLGALLLGFVLALLLNRHFLGRGVVRTLLITPFLIMPAAASLIFKTTIFDANFGMLNFFLKPFGVSHVDWVSDHAILSIIVLLVWQWTPFMMLILLAGLQSMPLDIIEAARVDGASEVGIFTNLTLPHMRRFVELAVTLGAIYIFQVFDPIFMVTQGGPGTATTTLPFYLYQRAFRDFEIGQAAALGVVVVIFSIVIATFALRAVSSLAEEKVR